MKISPVAGGMPGIAQADGPSVSAERLARAKAVAAGVTPPDAAPAAPVDRQVERVQRRIRLKTQVSPDRHERLEEAPEANAAPDPAAPATPEAAPTAPETPQSDTLASTEQASVASEDTRPLSPQFAALAKQKRALQLKEQELLAKEKALETQAGGTKSLEEYRSRLKANALSLLREEGVTYDQLTEQILASQEGPDLAALKAELKALKDGLETQTKTQAQREADAEKQALGQIRRSVDQLVATGDEFEMVREAGYAPKVVDLIHRVWKAEGIVLDEAEAAGMIEKELLEESLKFAKLKKVQSRLTPAPAQQQSQAVQQDRPGTKIMRTLTNRDGASSSKLSTRERAIAAMEGRLIK